ncbi:MAG TPA: thioesterase domain-containing protein [Rhodocyclaceae bacterium]|nr:thioesterase domain-containing protein [Rhodocyclaceae bacterium]
MSVLPVEQKLIDGPVGAIETMVEAIDNPQGIAVVAHPHPLFGGTNINKVVHTLARTLRDLGHVTLRPNFRGVGKSAGNHDNGYGETDDMLAVIKWAQDRWDKLPSKLPIILAGFSFGAYVQARVAKQLAAVGTPAKRLILVGTASGHVEGARSYDTDAVAQDTIVIHGAKDETVQLQNVLAWAEPLELPVIVVPGADHFFHARLHIIRNIIASAWH